MNITLSVEKHIAEQAREAANKLGKSLNQAVRDYLQQLAGAQQKPDEWAAFEARCLKNKNAKSGQLNGWKFNRDEVNQR